MTNTSKIILWLLVIIVVIIGIWYGVSRKPAEEEPIKIGAVLPLTGTESSWGADAKEGIELAVEEINSRGGIKNKKIEIIYEDGQCKPEPAVTAAQKLINVDRVSVIIGEICSSATLAIAPITETAKVVLISPGSASPKITEAGDFIFRNWITDKDGSTYLQ